MLANALFAGGRHKERFERNAPSATTLNYTVQADRDQADPIDWTYNPHSVSYVSASGTRRTQYQAQYNRWSMQDPTTWSCGWEIDSDDAFLSPGTGPMTFAITFLANVNYSKLTPMYENHESGAGIVSIRFTTSDGLECYLIDSDGTSARTSDGADWSNNQWHTLILTRSGINSWLFIDGNIESSKSTAGLGNINTVGNSAAYIGWSRYYSSYGAYGHKLGPILFHKSVWTLYDARHYCEMQRAKGY